MCVPIEYGYTLMSFFFHIFLILLDSFLGWFVVVVFLFCFCFRDKQCLNQSKKLK